MRGGWVCGVDLGVKSWVKEVRRTEMMRWVLGKGADGSGRFCSGSQVGQSRLATTRLTLMSAYTPMRLGSAG